MRSPGKLALKMLSGLPAFALKLLLTFSSTSMVLFIYQVKSPFIFEDLSGACRYLLLIVIFFLLILITYFALQATSRLSEDSFVQESVAAIGNANSTFLPSYLGYFFVALSVTDVTTLVFVYAIIFLFTYFSQALYFNPVFLLFRYNFYNVTTKAGTVIFLISKKKFRTPDDVVIKSANRINDYTFLEKEKDEYSNCEN